MLFLSILHPLKGPKNMGGGLRCCQVGAGEGEGQPFN